MFSFISFRRIARIVFTLLVMLCLSSALFIGCKDEPENKEEPKNPEDPGYQLDSRLIGTWEDQWGGNADNADGYIITATRVDYFFNGYGSEGVQYGGTIEYVTTVSNAGIIIIKYDNNAYNATLVGKFNAIYYEDLKAGVSVGMSTATNLSDWSDPATSTLDEAKTTFTIGNTGNYIGMFGGPYLKK
jgi:hypothetical protein